MYHGQKLHEIAAKAEACPKAMGIVKTGDGFAIRCKREDAASVRAQLLPDSAYVETAAFTNDQTLYDSMLQKMFHRWGGKS